MKQTILILAGILALINFSCITPNIIVSENLKTNTSVMEVKGKQGWQINQVIRYGDYATTKVKRGWTKGYNTKFIAHFQKASQKLSFTQITPLNEAQVFAVSKFKSTEMELIRNFLSYSLHYENYFSGVVIPKNNKWNEWNFIIHNPEGGTNKNFDCGMATDNNGNVITITGVREIEKQLNLVRLDNFGFEFSINGEAIAAVSTLNNGRVWINDTISEELKLVVSSMSTCLLVRHSMTDSFQ